MGTFGKDDRDENVKSRSKRAKQLIWSEAMRELPRLTVGGVAMVVSSYANQAVPRLIGRLMDPSKGRDVQSSKCPQPLYSNILFIGALGGFASFLRTLMLNQAQDSIAARLRSRAFVTLMTAKELEWFQVPRGESETESGNDDERGARNQSEELKDAATSTISTSEKGMTPAAISIILKDDVEMVASSATVTFANLLRSTSSCVFGTYNMISLNPGLLGLALVVAPAVGFLALLTRKTLKQILTIQQEAAIDGATFLEERLDNIGLVKIANREKDEIAKFNELQEEWTNLGRRSALANGISMGSMFFLSSTALCGILLRGGKAVEQNRMTRGELVSFATYSGLLALGTAGLVKASGEYMKGVQCASRLCELLQNDDSETLLESERMEPKDLSRLNRLDISEVCFTYHSRPTYNVLRDVTFSVAKGEVVVVTGKNGAGKSTLVHILAGLYSPATGGIFLNDSELNNGAQRLTSMVDLNRQDRASLLQVVSQNPALLNDTIANNIRYTNPTASDEEFSKAMKAANCETFVSKLDGGVDYHVGRNGSRLSGGQRQRVCLARAILADPSFLVLDEPASSMDNEGETAMMEAIRNCRAGNRGLVLITHRAKALEVADRVIVLKGGVVVEQGTLSQLQKQNGELCALMPELE